jgi:hypothetical protein
MNSTLIGLLALVATVQAGTSPPEAASQAAVIPVTSGRQSAPNKGGPFAKLFVPPQETKKRVQLYPQGARQQTLQTAPKIVCGMTVLPADPTVDPKMIQRPSETTVTAFIRRIPPPTCSE